jgi:hypothetical protein
MLTGRLCMDSFSTGVINQWYATIMAALPGILGAIIVLVLGWIVGRLLGKAVRIALDKLSQYSIIDQSQFTGTVKKSGITIGYLGDIAVRCFVYLIAILAAVDILNLDYLSALMVSMVAYIPHVVAFIMIIVVGFILIDYFIDFLSKFSSTATIELITPVLLVLRLFLYFVVVILGLSQLMLDLTIIYTFATPIAWGLGIGLGAAIAIMFWFGMKERGVIYIDRALDLLMKKE